MRLAQEATSCTRQLSSSRRCRPIASHLLREPPHVTHSYTSQMGNTI